MSCSWLPGPLIVQAGSPSKPTTGSSCLAPLEEAVQHRMRSCSQGHCDEMGSNHFPPDCQPEGAGAGSLLMTSLRQPWFSARPLDSSGHSLVYFRPGIFRKIKYLAWDFQKELLFQLFACDWKLHTGTPQRMQWKSRPRREHFIWWLFGLPPLETGSLWARVLYTSVSEASTSPGGCASQS